MRTVDGGMFVMVRFTREEMCHCITILRILQFLPEISGAMVSLLVVVDSGVVGGPMASLHHLVTDLSPLQTWQEGEAGQRQQHQMYTDMQTVIVTFTMMKL